MMRTEYLEIASLQEWVAWAEAYAQKVNPMQTSKNNGVEAPRASPE